MTSAGNDRTSSGNVVPGTLLSFATGVALCAGIGALAGDLWAGLTIGVAIGAALGAGFARANKRG